MDQVRNGAADSPNDPGDWVNGNAGPQNAHFLEGWSIPYRVVMTDLPTDGTVINLTLGYDIKHGDRHALDFLTNYSRLDPYHFDFFGHDPEEIDPLIGVTGVSGTYSTYTIPAPSSAGSPVTNQPTQGYNDLVAAEGPQSVYMTLFGGTIIDISYGIEGDLTASNSETQINIIFTVDSSTAVLSWGGHIASRLDWGYDEDGVPRSAGGITGSPYHMCLVNWNLTNLGSQDRSLKSAAVYLPGVKAGYKWNDLDGDGIWDEGELGLTDWTIELRNATGNTIDTFTTGADGYYEFSGLGSGTYRVYEVLEPGWVQTFPVSPEYYEFTVTTGFSETNNSFGNFKLGVKEGYKWDDTDGDGVKDAGELGLSGWVIELLDDTDTVIVSTTTDADGWYNFTGLTVGNYTVREVLKEGWMQTYPEYGNHTITVVSGFEETDNDFGNFKNVDVTAWKFEDLDGDGDADVPIEGWEVYLTIDGVVVDTQYTDASGKYTWTNLGPLPAGRYYDIGEYVDPGWIATSPTSYDFESPPKSGASYSGIFTNHKIVEFLKYFNDAGAINNFTEPEGPFPGTNSTINQIKTGPQIWWEVTYSVTNEDGEGHFYTLWDKWGGNLLILGGYPTAYTPANGNGKGAGWLTLSNASAFKIDYTGYTGYLSSYGNISGNIVYAATHDDHLTDGAWMSIHTGDQQEGTNPGKGNSKNKDGNSYDIDIRWNIGWLEPNETQTLTIYLAPGINPGGVLQFSSYNNYTVNTGPRVRAYESDLYLDNEFLYSWDWTNQHIIEVQKPQ